MALFSNRGGEPRPVIPALAPLYARTPDIAWLIVRVTAGLMLLPHGIPKIFTQGVAAFAAAGLSKRGIEPALPFAFVVVFLETVGGVMVALGLLTRFFAGAVAIEMAMIAYHVSVRGLRLGERRLRVSAVLGPDHVRDRAARRRTVLAGPQDREGALSRLRQMPQSACAAPKYRAGLTNHAHQHPFCRPVHGRPARHRLPDAFRYCRNDHLARRTRTALLQ